MAERTAILYVEDNPDNRLLVRRVLEAEGFQVLEAYNAASALEVVDRQSPDLVLMDINLPEVDGLTLAARLKNLPNMRGIPIVALTANVMRGDRERTLKAGCDGYIQKPIDVDNLPVQINRYLERKKQA
jgi:two-component system, cell cycle response regulator DivK